jgi:hypothetical protein
MGLFLQITQCVDESTIGGRRQFMEAATMTSVDPTSTSGICHYGQIVKDSNCLKHDVAHLTH